MIDKIVKMLGTDARSLLEHKCATIPKNDLHLPGPDMVDRIYVSSDRSNSVLRNLQSMFSHGRLGGTGYLSILPVDQGIEHSAGASFAPNPIYFDPENIVKLAVEGGCNAVASTLGVLGLVSRKYVHKIPFVVKINHNELLTYPESYDQKLFGSVRQSFDMGAVGVGATIYFGSAESRRQIEEIAKAFEEAHRLGMFTILWCYLRNSAFIDLSASKDKEVVNTAFSLGEKGRYTGLPSAVGKEKASKKDGVDYHEAADLTGQANHLGVTIEADIIKQKQPVNNGGYNAIKFGKTHKLVYSQLSSNHPVDLTRYQVANCYMGRIGLINSGGASGENDLAQAVKTAVINKRAGGMGLISGRKAFQKPLKDGIEILHAIQDVYLCKDVTIA